MEKNEVLNNNAITLRKIQSIGTDYSFKHEVVWLNVIFFLILHLFALWGLVILLAGGVCFITFLWVFFFSWCGGIGITVGAHRHFTYKIFKAKPVLRLFFRDNPPDIAAPVYSVLARIYRGKPKSSGTSEVPGSRGNATAVIVLTTNLIRRKSYTSRKKGYFILWCGGIGLTVGAHRHFTHKTFKAKPVLRALLIILQTIAGENSMFVWCRDHRVHHRFSDTDADPHNANRGFFFSHIGWLMTKKHPYVIEFGKTVDVSDLQSDWMVMFQKKYFFILYALFAVFIPVWVPVYFFGDSLWNCLLVCYFSRYIIGLNITWLVNSAAHLYGTRPYDKNIHPVESWMIAFLAIGEGWHNYHHAFPWDYNAAELTMHFNPSAKVIRFLEKIGLAYDLKTVAPEMVAERIKRRGDGTHYLLGNDDGRDSVTAFGPLHPMNPTYNSTLKVPNAKHD